MRILTILAVLLLNLFSTDNNKLIATEISVTVSNVTSEEGKVIFGLYTEDNFMKEPFKNATSEIKDGIASVTFQDVPKGTYAVIALHDANDNDKMDFESNGMPKENYGTSNNIFAMGPSQWTDSKFEVDDQPVSFEIRFYSFSEKFLRF